MQKYKCGMEKFFIILALGLAFALFMIGDSGTEFHKEMEFDSALEKQLCDLTSRQAKVTSKGKSNKRNRVRPFSFIVKD